MLLSGLVATPPTHPAGLKSDADAAARRTMIRRLNLLQGRTEGILQVRAGV
jgi:hypothetical protein